MPLPVANTFEAGIADETTITAANSVGGGTPFDFVTIAGTAIAVFDNAIAVHGSFSARMQQNGANAVSVEWTFGNYTEIWGRVYIYRTAVPAPNGQWLVSLFDAGGSGQNGLIQWWTDGTLLVYDSALSTFVQSSNAIPLNEWARIEWHLLCSTTVGILEAKFFHGDSITPIETVIFSPGNTFTQVNDVIIGNRASQDAGGPFWIDDPAITNIGYPGPDVPSFEIGATGEPFWS